MRKTTCFKKGCENVRNEKLDFWKGIATLGILALHTSSYACAAIVPIWFRSCVMLCEVPLFFFLSGEGSYYYEGNVNKTCLNIGKMWIKWIFFVACVWLIQGLTFHEWVGWSSFIGGCLFKPSFMYFPVVNDSIWFMPYYFVIILIMQTVFLILKKLGGGVKQKRILCVVLSLAWLSVSYGHDFLGLDQTFLFFSALFVLGNVCLEVQLNTRAYILFSVLCVLGWWISGYEQKDILLVDLLNSKFPPRLVYGFACMLGILLSMYYRGKYNKFINHIGKRSTYYFFAQGVSCSIMYHLV